MARSPAPLVLLLLVVGCTGRRAPDADGPAPDSTGDSAPDSAPDTGPVAPTASSVAFGLPGQPNLLLPFKVAVDAAHRRAWVTALGTRTLAAVDVDAGTLSGVYALPALTYSYPAVAADSAGSAWVTGAAQLVRVDPDGGVATPFDLGVHATATPLADGDDVIVSGSGTSTPMLVRVAHDGHVVTRAELGGRAFALAPTLDAAQFLSSSESSDGTGLVEVRARDTLAVEHTCASPLPAALAMAALPDGNVVVLDDTHVGLARCDGGAPTVVTVGLENKSAAVVADGFVVYDRIGDASSGGSAEGIARTFDAALEVVAAAPTGKNSGYSAVDSVTGAVWINSEDTTEVRAYDPVTGAERARVRLGAHVEQFAVSPEAPGVAWVTGRLSGLVARADLAGGSFVPAAEAPEWPVAPVVADGALYVLDQVFNVVYVYDADTLALRRTLPLGAAENDTLGFSDLRVSDAGTLLAAVAGVDTLYEVDPGDGAVLSAVSLGFPPLTDPNDAGRLEIRSVGRTVWVTRTQDAQAARVDLDSGAVTAATLVGPEDLPGLQYDLAPRLGYLSSDAAWLFFGGRAFDATTLAAAPAQDRDATRVLDDADGAWTVWDADDQALYRLADGARTRIADIPIAQGDPYVAWLGAWGGGAMWVDAEQAELEALTPL